MADHAPLSAADRIDRALTRIETALAERRRVSGPADPTLAERHAALRKRTAEALAALDDLLDRAGAQ